MRDEFCLRLLLIMLVMSIGYIRVSLLLLLLPTQNWLTVLCLLSVVREPYEDEHC